ncbi:MAG: hypothetical protein FLDDKLPJ_03348 [Phycisphaerae bacterium]|nr:hypothetical protein [Phycisphaerae bacterium]
MNTKWFYSACEQCTAKWFSRTPESRCPRCGGWRLLHMLENPPWLPDRVLREDTEERPVYVDAVADSCSEPSLMIALGCEALIAVSELPALLPRRQNGKRIHLSACYRWISRGIGPDKRKLEAIRIGRTMYTSWEALARFAQALGPAAPMDVAANIISPAVLARRKRDAAQQVAVELGLGRTPSRVTVKGASDGTNKD